MRAARMSTPACERSLTSIRRVLDRHAASLIVGVTAILAAAFLVVGAVGLSS